MCVSDASDKDEPVRREASKGVLHCTFQYSTVQYITVQGIS